ncbi:Uncharacterized protein SCF082_LOCUS35815, partial [Durusdinium trenchii]
EVSVRVGPNFFQISGLGMLRATDVSASSVQAHERIVRLALVVQDGIEAREVVLALQFDSEASATQAMAALEAALAGFQGACGGSQAVQPEDIAAVIMDPGFPTLLGRVRQLLSASASFGEELH